MALTLDYILVGSLVATWPRLLPHFDSTCSLAA